MSAQPEYLNFRERLQALARRPGIVRLVTTRSYTARILAVGQDFVEFDELDRNLERLATHLVPMREIKGLATDVLDVQREMLDQLFRLPGPEGPA